MKWWINQKLYVKIIICIIIGAILGITLGDKATNVLDPIGNIFIRLLKMLIAPVVFFTIVSGIIKMQDVKSLRSIGGKLMVYYVLTSILAAVIGIVTALIIRPGIEGAAGIVEEGVKVEVTKFNFIDNMVSWVPTNPFEALVTANVLQILFFAILLGIVLLIMGERVKKLNEIIDMCAETMIKVTDIVMKFSPYGILALIASMVNSLGLQTLAEVAKFIIADYIAILILLIFVYPIQLKMSKLSIKRFYQGISPAIIIAASTTSSAATLPVSLNVAEKNLKIPEKIYGFGLTVGATINTNGMAAALGVIAVFAANIYGLPITLPLMVQIVFLGLILSMGTAGVKGAGIVLSTVLLQSLNLPLDLVPIFAAIWPVIDIGHTTVNVVGDLVGVTKIAANAGEISIEDFNNPAISNTGA